LIISFDNCLLQLRAGDLVALPSETVYGLAGNALLDSTLDLIYKLKGRPSYNPLIVHTTGLDQAGNLAHFNHLATRLAEVFWPGPLTLILPKKDCIPERISAGLPTVALRSPAHPLFREVLGQLDFPLAAPSANRSNHISPTCPEHVMESFGENCPKILDGGSCQIGLESTVLSLVDPQNIKIFREGPISAKEIRAVLRTDVQKVTSESDEKKGKILPATEPQLSPGTGSIHYAPQTPLLLHASVEILCANADKTGKDTILLVHRDQDKQLWNEKNIPVISLSKDGDPAEIAHNLYSCLHLADKAGKSSIQIASLPDEHHLAGAVNDRLFRASRKDTIISI
jgi:L-threonylcarbamoyladenylate synthase